MSNSRKEQNPLYEVSLTSYLLGIASGVSLTIILAIPQFPKNLAIYLLLLTNFHFLEYFITARFQPNRVTVDSFILRNGSTYIIAHTFALVEFALEYFLFSSYKCSTSNLFLTIKTLGIIISLLGQFIRSLSMITAGQNFSHIIQDEKDENHKLVTHGIYSYLRHPSYFGFFYYAIGTQLLLLNPISFIFFSIVLFKFFSSRIRYEEKTLIQFFKEDYLNYKKTTPVGIPFVN